MLQYKYSTHMVSVSSVEDLSKNQKHVAIFLYESSKFMDISQVRYNMIKQIVLKNRNQDIVQLELFRK